MIAPSAIFAASSSYDFTVPKTSDKEDGNITKQHDENAENRVDSINGSLGSWIESTEYDGLNLTYKTYYSTTGTKPMEYKPSDKTHEYIGWKCRLNVSTSLTQLSPVDTSGTWSPDEL